MALQSLFTNNPQPPYTSLFAFNNSFFLQQNVTDNFRARLLARRVLALRYLGYSFRKDVVQYVLDYKMLDKNIQKLGF